MAAPHPPLSGIPLLLATAALGLASFMNILDLSIANVSVPTIAGDLGVSVTQGTWVITSYAVAEAIMLPLTGWLAGRFGQVRMFTAATLMFTLASALCGLSPSFEMLLAARILQGVFGASMIPLSQALMTSIYPPQKRGLAMGLWSMTTVVAPIAGPLAGGWLTENLSWHWIFLINLPVGLLVSLFAWELLADRETPRQQLPIDFIGLGLLVIGIGSLQILLDKGNELDWFNSPTVITLACISFIALCFFVIWEWYEAHPVVNLRLFTRRNFTVGVVCLMLGSVAFFGTVVILPLWLQTYHDYTPLWAGKAVAFGGVFAVILGPVVGANLHRLDARAVASFGFIVFAGTAFWSTTFTPDVDYWSVALTRLIMGVGISCFFLPLITINLSGLTPGEMAGASGISNFMRNIGSSFGTAAVTSLWDHRGIQHHAVLVEHATRQDPAAVAYLTQLQGLGMSTDQALGYLNREITTQAYLLATNDVFLASGFLMLSLLALIWWTRPPFTPAGGGH